MTSFFEDESRVEPLIVCHDERYEVNAETVRWIEEHDKPIVVVACAGKYRTGKSFLLNRLAKAEGGCGFGVGNSVQACTKGLWIYKEFFPSDDGSKSLLFVDTEGIDALDANDTHDVRIFTLALLLSSALCHAPAPLPSLPPSRPTDTQRHRVRIRWARSTRRPCRPSRSWRA
jgi:hypothetical protein